MLQCFVIDLLHQVWGESVHELSFLLTPFRITFKSINYVVIDRPCQCYFQSNRPVFIAKERNQTWMMIQRVCDSIRWRQRRRCLNSASVLPNLFHRGPTVCSCSGGQSQIYDRCNNN